MKQVKITDVFPNLTAAVNIVNAILKNIPIQNIDYENLFKHSKNELDGAIYFSTNDIANTMLDIILSNIQYKGLQNIIGNNKVLKFEVCAEDNYAHIDINIPEILESKAEEYFNNYFNNCHLEIEIN